MEDTASLIIEYLAIFIALLIVMPLHEFAHAFVADKCGDGTPRSEGRLTLNPFAHFDVLGLIMLVVCKFGWAKPVPVNPYNFKHLRRDYFFVAIAGVVTNYLLAIIFYPLWLLSIFLLKDVDLLLFDELIEYTLYFGYVINLNLVVFNLIPIHPLDGFKVLEAIINKPSKVLDFLRANGQYILLGLLIINYLNGRFGTNLPILNYIDIFGWFMSFMTGLIGWPISTLWNCIFSLFM